MNSTINVTLPTMLVDWLKDWAFKEGFSLNEAVRIMVQEYLDKEMM